MAESFLQQQLDKVRQLIERVNDVQDRVARNSELIARDRESMHGSPLHEARDLRPHANAHRERTHESRRPPRDRADEVISHPHAARRRRR